MGLSLNKQQIQELAGNLLRAESERKPIAPLTVSYPGMTVDDAYAVQLEITAAKKAAGHTVVGRKIGLTSKAMQQMFGVDEPDYGLLYEEMIVKSGGSLDCHTMIQPKAEAEIAFMLSRDLQGPGVTAADAINATSYIVPVLEIVDSRIADWKIKLPDTVADNASSARVVVGAEHHKPGAYDLRLVGMAMQKNGEIVAAGSGADVMDHPANAVAWLANKMGSLGEKLEAGHLILPGSLCAAIAVVRGDKVMAKFHPLGIVEITFV